MVAGVVVRESEGVQIAVVCVRVEYGGRELDPAQCGVARRTRCKC